MSIYFVHFLISVLPLSILMAFIASDKNIFLKVFSSFLGFLFGYFAFLSQHNF